MRSGCHLPELSPNVFIRELYFFFTNEKKVTKHFAYKIRLRPISNFGHTRTQKYTKTFGRTKASSWTGLLRHFPFPPPKWKCLMSLAYAKEAHRISVQPTLPVLQCFFCKKNHPKTANFKIISENL